MERWSNVAPWPRCSQADPVSGLPATVPPVGAGRGHLPCGPDCNAFRISAPLRALTRSVRGGCERQGNPTTAGGPHSRGGDRSIPPETRHPGATPLPAPSLPPGPRSSHASTGAFPAHTGPTMRRDGHLRSGLPRPARRPPARGRGSRVDRAPPGPLAFGASHILPRNQDKGELRPQTGPAVQESEVARSHLNVPRFKRRGARGIPPGPEGAYGDPSQNPP